MGTDASRGPEDLSTQERTQLRRAHERLRTGSRELEALVATEPIRARWEPEPAPPEILDAARAELHAAYDGLMIRYREILGWGEGAAEMTDTLQVLDDGRAITFSFEEMLKYHGPSAPGGVAHAFKVLERACPLLDPGGPPERREIVVNTAFGGPGARDGIEMVTRAMTGDRYVVDRALARPELGPNRERFVFRLGYRGRSVTLLLREGYVTDEFIALARKQGRGAADAARLDELKGEMADRVMGSPAEEVYDTAQ